MCKCMKKCNPATLLNNNEKTAQVSVIVNVTDIVKYVALAGVAIVGIIFGTKTIHGYLQTKEDEEE